MLPAAVTEPHARTLPWAVLATLHIRAGTQREWGLVGGSTVRSLRLAPAPPDASCWFAGDGWWLSTDPVEDVDSPYR